MHWVSMRATMHAMDERTMRARAMADEGRSQPEIAAALGVHQSTVSRWLRGNPPNRPTRPSPIQNPLRRTEHAPALRLVASPHVPPATLPAQAPSAAATAWPDRLPEAAEGWACLLTDLMVAQSIGAPPVTFATFLAQGARDHAASLDTEAARWSQVRGEAIALPVKRSAEVLVRLLDHPDARTRLKAAQFIQERVGGLAAPAPVQVQVTQAVAVNNSGPSVVVGALNAAFQRKLEAEVADAQVVEVAG
jgi:hypothetical protein